MAALDHGYGAPYDDATTTEVTLTTPSAPARAPGADQAPEGEPAISVRGLVKSFGQVRALDGVDLEVAPGTVLG
ncbi:MAG TPA: hypothetical protein VGV36_08935, partial [Solirubrobacteraceae bacterium]|nr:hypothetical protein [Solirubrobacteraceae bacterium]